MGINDQMKFEIVRDRILAVLVANQGSLFRTILGQKERVDASEVKGNLRTIQVFYESGNYAYEKSGKREKEHECEYRLEYKLSRAATADLLVLENPSATSSQLQSALLAVDNASTLADKAMDEFRRIISQILLDPANRGLGLRQDPNAQGSFGYIISRQRLERFRKNQPLPRGGLIVLTASETFTTTVTEVFDGADVTPAAQIPIDFTTGIIENDGDPETVVSNFGVEPDAP